MAKKKGNNLPAKVEQQELFPAVPKEMAAQFIEDAKENLQNVKDAFYRINIRGGRFSVDDQLIGDRGIEFEAIILKEVPINVWYETAYDANNPTSPDCWSLGGLKPDPSCNYAQSASCITCKNNKFGSAVGRDGKKRSKACRNTRRLVLKVLGVDMPVLLSLPPTSIKAFNNYLKEISRGKVPIPVFAVKTIFSFDPSVEYPRPVMSRGEFLKSEEYKDIKVYRNGQEVEIAYRAYASTEDYEAVPEDDKEI